MLNKIIKKIILREKADSQSFVAYLRKKGATIGENVRFFSPSNTLVDMQAPWLVSIGDNVNVTHGVIILTHDYSWAVLKRFSKSEGAILGAQSPVIIGNNVFIGMNAIITRGVTIGDNVVIGAGSVVTHDCQSNSVYAGNPARRIMSLDEYLAKREQCQFEEARKMALAYKEHFGVEPGQEIFSEYFMLFCGSDNAASVPAFKSQMETGANYSETVQYMNTHKPMFDSYEAFLAECYK
jgi:acetyltransferase-like isoleucine patch superfamily enzyme